MHGYYDRKIANDTQIDKHLSNLWKKKKFVTSHLENYHATIQDQALPTKHLKDKRARDSGKHLIVTTNADCIPPLLKT